MVTFKLRTECQEGASNIEIGRQRTPAVGTASDEANIKASAISETMIKCTPPWGKCPAAQLVAGTKGKQLAEGNHLP